MGLQLSLRVSDFFLNSEVTPVSFTSEGKTDLYTDVCFQENIWQTLLSFLPELLLEHLFVVFFFAVCRFLNSKRNSS